MVLLVLALLAASAYLARRTLAREALVGWLEDRGVEAEVDFRRIGLGGAVARIHVGPESDPEFAVERAEVDYVIQGPWSGEPLGLEVGRVKLVRPVVRARWQDGDLSFGSLDRLVEEYRQRPPRPDAAKPRVLVEEGIVRVVAPYGRIEARGDALVDDGKLMRLTARLSPGRLRDETFSAAIRGGGLQLVTRGDRVDVSVEANIDDFVAGQTRLRKVNARFSGEAPYPDLEQRRGDGAVTLSFTVDAGGLEHGDQTAREAALAGEFQGRVEGWIEDLVVTGAGEGTLTAAAASSGDLVTEGLALELAADRLAWRRPDGDRVTSEFRAGVSADAARRGDIRLTQVAARLDGDGAFGPGERRLQLTGGAYAQGAWPLFGPVERTDDAAIAAVKRALADFRLRAPALSAKLDDDGLAVRLRGPARLDSANGAVTLISGRSEAPLYVDGQGAFDLQLSGGEAPTLTATVERYQLQPDGLVARGGLQVAGDFNIFQAAQVDARGRLRVKDGAVLFTADRCAPVRAGRLELGENDVADVAGELCLAGAPLFAIRDGRWRLDAEMRGVSAAAPFLETRVADAAGRLRAGGRGEDVQLSAEVAQARLYDTATPTRYRPIRLAGEADLTGGHWRGRFDLFDLQGRDLGRAQLAHDQASGVGRLDLDTGSLRFEEGGLQPLDLSPMVTFVGSPASGEVRFVGGFAWTATSLDSGGVLTIPDLDFRSAAGPVQGLSGQIVFSSLAPLATAPNQALRAERVEAFAPLTGAVATFRLADDTVFIEGGSVALGGGRIRVEPFAIPLVGEAPWNGVMQIEGVQLSDVVEHSALADKMDLRAKVSGTVPFRVTDQGLRFSGGQLRAVEPGRLSIRREALSAVSAGGAEQAEAPNTVTDFAYQAMENLAFSQLSAEINSLPGGRLGVLFRVQGEHAPPKLQEIRLGLLELIRRDFLDRTLPLPSGTQVNLTLDTTLNLDQLLSDLAEYQRLRQGDAPGSDAVQP